MFTFHLKFIRSAPEAKTIGTTLSISGSTYCAILNINGKHSLFIVSANVLGRDHGCHAWQGNTKLAKNAPTLRNSSWQLHKNRNSAHLSSLNSSRLTKSHRIVSDRHDGSEQSKLRYNISTIRFYIAKYNPKCNDSPSRCFLQAALGLGPNLSQLVRHAPSQD